MVTCSPQNAYSSKAKGLGHPTENGSQNISEYDESDLTEAERQDWESIIVEDEAFQENMPEQPVPSEAYLAGNRTRN